jgi:hypothetical protein
LWSRGVCGRGWSSFRLACRRIDGRGRAGVRVGIFIAAFIRVITLTSFSIFFSIIMKPALLI